jgi:hypothetical protein
MSTEGSAHLAMLRTERDRAHQKALAGRLATGHSLRRLQRVTKASYQMVSVLTIHGDPQILNHIYSQLHAALWDVRSLLGDLEADQEALARAEGALKAAEGVSE